VNLDLDADFLSVGHDLALDAVDAADEGDMRPRR